MDGRLPTWLSIDLEMLTSDLGQLRTHLGWLREDLREQQGIAAGPAGDDWTAQMETSLDHLAALDRLLVRLGQALGR